ncbi:MAG: hypothetical protein ABIG20_02790 [archaeon]
MARNVPKIIVHVVSAEEFKTKFDECTHGKRKPLLIEIPNMTTETAEIYLTRYISFLQNSKNSGLLLKSETKVLQEDGKPKFLLEVYEFEQIDQTQEVGGAKELTTVKREKPHHILIESGPETPGMAKLVLYLHPSDTNTRIIIDAWKFFKQNEKKKQAEFHAWLDVVGTRIQIQKIQAK